MIEPYLTFRDFVLLLMKKEDVSANELARRVDLSNATVSRLVDASGPVIPELKTVMKFSKYTGVSLAHLTELAYPDVAEQTKPSASSQVIAQLIEKLPEYKRRSLLDFIGAGE